MGDLVSVVFLASLYLGCRGKKNVGSGSSSRAQFLMVIRKTFVGNFRNILKDHFVDVFPQVNGTCFVDSGAVL